MPREHGAKGIVIAGVGNGNMNKASLEAAARAVKKGVVVVRSSRVATGTVGRNVEVNDDELGFIASDELNPAESADPALAGAPEAAHSAADSRDVLYLLTRKIWRPANRGRRPGVGAPRCRNRHLR